jgi:hypothetical protein
MNVIPPHLEFIAVADTAVGKATLPNWELRGQLMREPSLDQSHNALKRYSLRAKQQMNVIRHDDKCVQLVVACAPLVLERLEKQLCVGCNLKESTAIEGPTRHKVGSRLSRMRGNRHCEIARPWLVDVIGTREERSFKSPYQLH